MNAVNYLLRTEYLAYQADAATLDNPSVGAALAYDGRIIGEGYHRRAGEAHAEVNCLRSVRKADREFISRSTLYVSLEPCSIYGRTPPCTQLILDHRIPRVVCTQSDPTPGVAGRGFQLLREGGVEVIERPEFQPTLDLNRPRATLILKERPFIILKYAESADGFLRPADRSADYWITNPISRRLVHRWRANVQGILVGGRTVVDDDPSLTTRLFPGPSPQPIVLDPRGVVRGTERIFHQPRSPLVVAPLLSTKASSEVLTPSAPALSPAYLQEVFTELRRRKLKTILVEGGRAVLNAFIAAGYWDEARLFTGTSYFDNGLRAPELGSGPGRPELIDDRMIAGDRLRIFRNATAARRLDARLLGD